MYLGCIVEAHPDIGDRMAHLSQPLPNKPEFPMYWRLTGVTEAINGHDELFGDSRLLEIMNHTLNQNLQELLSHIKEEIDVFTGEQEQFDDITMLIMEYQNYMFNGS